MSKKRVSPFAGVRYEHLVAGVSGGVASTLILHPLDLLKIRFAVSDGATASAKPHYTGLTQAMGQIFRHEGIRGLYRGVTPNVWGAGSAWGFYFLFYNTIKSYLQGGNSKVHLGPGLHMAAAAEAGVLTLVMTNPIWVVKTRLCLQYTGGASAAASSTHYNGMMDALIKTYKYEGVRGLYKGFVPGVFGVSHGALQFMAYEEMKAQYNRYRNLPIDAKLTMVEYLTFASLSKLFAAITTYPYQVLRARMQDQHAHYDNLRHCIKETWRQHGVLGFYKGLSPNLMRVVPATALTFLVYEKTSHFLLQLRPAEDTSPPSQDQPPQPPAPQDLAPHQGKETNG